MTVFAKILDGSIPCHRVHEDEHCLAFLDINPLSRGHTLLIPKERVARVHEMSDEQSAAIGRVLPRLCRAIVQVTGAVGYNVICNTGERAGQEVMHVHFHVIPKFEDGTGLGLTHEAWQAGVLEDGDGLVGELRAVM